MTLCDCGKPNTHRGMCTARWQVRKANNGPSGLKAKAPAPIVHKTYGDLADSILPLRGRGHLVARFKDGIRVDNDVLSDDQVRARAEALRRPVAKATRAKNAQVQESCGGGDGPARCVPRVPANAWAASKASREAGVESGPQDFIARIAQLEQEVARLYAVVADALKGRRECLVEQATGLASIEATLRSSNQQTGEGRA